jgi:uncharacterized protein (DUF305 family)
MSHVACHRQHSTALRLAAGSLALGLLTAAVTQGCSAREGGVRLAQGMGPGWMWGRQGGAADQHFIVMMVPHHEGAIAMAGLAVTRAKRPEIRELARRIKASQEQENDQMRRWYRQWYGQDLPAWSPGDSWGWRHRGMMGGGMMGGGMMGGRSGLGGPSGTNIDALKNAVDFDKEFIEQMIPHHQMGVMMATMEFNHTERPEMRKLAEAMIRVQSDEIKTMQQWYRNWYP